MSATQEQIIREYLSDGTGQDRCDRCSWPLAESEDKGCVIGNCSMRSSNLSDYRSEAEQKLRAALRALLREREELLRDAAWQAEIQAGHPAMCCGQCDKAVHDAQARVSELEAQPQEARGTNERWERISALSDMAGLDVTWQRMAREHHEAKIALAASEEARKRAEAERDSVLTSTTDERLKAKEAATERIVREAELRVKVLEAQIKHEPRPDNAPYDPSTPDGKLIQRAEAAEEKLARLREVIAHRINNTRSDELTGTKVGMGWVRSMLESRGRLTMGADPKKPKATLEDQAWLRAYSWAQRNGYETIRDCRIIAMAYVLGWKAGRRGKRRASR